MFSSSRFKTCVISSKCVPLMKTLVLSVNNIEKSRSKDLEKSFIYIINKSGPRIDPCGTPCVICISSKTKINR